MDAILLFDAACRTDANHAIAWELLGTRYGQVFLCSFFFLVVVLQPEAVSCHAVLFCSLYFLCCEFLRCQ